MTKQRVRVKVTADSVEIWSKIDGYPNMRVSGLGKKWRTRAGNVYQYAYLEWNRLDAMYHDKKAGYLR